MMFEKESSTACSVSAEMSCSSLGIAIRKERTPVVRLPVRFFLLILSITQGTRLNLLSISPLHDDEISALACDSRRVYSAAGGEIFSWKKGVEVSAEGENH